MQERIDDPDTAAAPAAPGGADPSPPVAPTGKRRGAAEAIGGLEVTELSFEAVARLLADDSWMPTP